MSELTPKQRVRITRLRDRAYSWAPRDEYGYRRCGYIGGAVWNYSVRAANVIGALTYAADENWQGINRIWAASERQLIFRSDCETGLAGGQQLHKAVEGK